MKKIISFESIGLTEETASIEGIVNALNDGDLLLIPMTTVRTGTGIVPANYGTMRVHRRSASYVMFEYQTLSDKWIGYYNAGTSSSKWSGWTKISTATPPQEYNLPLTEGITEQVHTSYCKSQEGLVFISGWVKGAAKSGTIAILPVGYRPRYAQQIVVPQSSDSDKNDTARIEIYTSGEIRLIGVGNEARIADGLSLCCSFPTLGS